MQLIRPLVLGALFSLSACVASNRIGARVETFHRIKSDIPPTYSFLPLKEQEGSLEYLTYQDLVRDGLDAHGWQEAPPDRAGVRIGFWYSIDNGTQHTSVAPTFGQTGVSGSTTSGTATSFGGMATYSSTTTYTPTYGVTGYVPITRTYYTRYFNLLVFPGDSFGKKEANVTPLLDSRAVSAGVSGSLAQVIPYLVAAVFDDFPGQSGAVRQVSFWASQPPPRFTQQAAIGQPPATPDHCETDSQCPGTTRCFDGRCRK